MTYQRINALRDRLWDAIQARTGARNPVAFYSWQADLWRKWSLWLTFRLV